ncbi:YraN family protein [Microbacterium sp. MM2322]|jgi:putative endonuclease|uniref:YraN family protein n=1 Tax=Microbacterium sp. MM2322 TaxID=3157631 RepID=UPI0032D5755A
MAAKDDLGRAGEQRAEMHLRAQGYRILDRNWRSHSGEIDIVAARDGDLVIVEVKTRRGEWFGHPFAAVHARKRDRLWRLGAAWVVAHPDAARGRRLRLDVIGITGPDPESAVVEHLEDLR